MTSVERLKKRAHGISLGVFAADLGALAQAARQARGWGCDILHFDVMDGVFVPGMIGGPGFVKALDIGAVRDVHLMVQAPARHVASYVEAGADIITVHAEATGAADALREIRRAATGAGRVVLAGLGLMPGTSLDAVRPLLDIQPDLILVLSLDPREGAGPDIGAACARLGQLRTRYSDTSGPLLAFDGGVTLDSMPEIAACRPDMVVSGSAVFKTTDPAGTFRQLAATLAPPAAGASST